ncbi:MAG: Rrf2 family transcriptional regulator [Hyphomicrobiales bacterium]
MKRNSRLSLALHTLGHMAVEQGEPRTSAHIAAHAGTNPVVVRRVLGRLREAGLLISEKGHAGGWKLAKSPTEISLADVYLALDEKLIATDKADEEPNCSLEYALRNQVSAVMEDIERTLIERLSSTTIAEVCKLKTS